MALIGGFVGIKIIAPILSAISWSDKMEMVLMMMGGILIPLSGIMTVLLIAEYFTGYLLAIGLHCFGIIFIIPELKKIRREC